MRSFSLVPLLKIFSDSSMLNIVNTDVVRKINTIRIDEYNYRD